MAPSLPAFGWTQHSEQVGLAALEARAWQISTTLHGGIVASGLLPAPDTTTIVKLESVAKHAATCTDPLCRVGLGIAATLCPNGKYDPTAQLFFTTARDLAGAQIFELCACATSPEEAQKNHYAACALLAGAVASWRPYMTEHV